MPATGTGTGTGRAQPQGPKSAPPLAAPLRTGQQPHSDLRTRDSRAELLPLPSHTLCTQTPGWQQQAVTDGPSRGAQVVRVGGPVNTQGSRAALRTSGHLVCSHVAGPPQPSQQGHPSGHPSAFCNMCWTSATENQLSRGLPGKETKFFFFLRSLFIFRERGREGERERNINVWLPLAHPYWGPGLQPRHVP